MFDPQRSAIDTPVPILVRQIDVCEVDRVETPCCGKDVEGAKRRVKPGVLDIPIAAELGWTKDLNHAKAVTIEDRIQFSKAILNIAIKGYYGIIADHLERTLTAIAHADRAITEFPAGDRIRPAGAGVEAEDEDILDRIDPAGLGECHGRRSLWVI